MMNTSDERHAFLIGLCETVTVVGGKAKLEDSKDEAAVEAEYHYYAAGRAVGMVILGLVGVVIRFWVV